MNDHTAKASPWNDFDLGERTLLPARPEVRARLRAPGPLTAIFVVVLIDVLGFTLVVPLLGLYAERFRATPLEATLLVSIYAACQLVSAPLLGRMSDRVGRKRVLVLSQIGTLAGFVLLARANALWILFAARAIDGATAGNIAVAEAFIVDHTAPKDRVKAFGLIGIAFGAGSFAGPFLAGCLSTFGLAAPIWAACGCSFVSVLLSAALLPPDTAVAAERASATKGRWGLGAHLFRGGAAGLFVQFSCFVFAFATFTSGFALFAERAFGWHGHALDARAIGLVLAWGGMVGVVLQVGFIGALVRRFGEGRLASAGFALLVLSYLGLSAARTLPVLLVAIAALALGHGVVRPALIALVTRGAARHEQGAVLGVNQSLTAIAQIVAPIVAGLLIGRGHSAVWALVAAGAALLGLVAGAISNRVRAHSSAPIDTNDTIVDLRALDDADADALLGGTRRVRSRRFLAFAEAASLGVATLALFALHQLVRARREAAPSLALAPHAGGRVVVAKVESVPPGHAVSLLGDVRPLRQVTVYSKVSGYLKDVRVERGDRVRQEQILGTVETLETDSQIVAASADYGLRQREADRARKLSADAVIARAELDRANAALLSAQAGLSRVRAAKAYATIRAPFDGVVTARFADPGALLQGATASLQALPLVEVSDLSRVRVTFFVAQLDAAFVHEGTRVALFTDAAPLHKIEAAITRTNHALDPRTRTLQCEVELPNPNEGFPVGGALHVSFVADTPGALAVPTEAVFFRHGRPAVMVVRDERADLTPVEIGDDDGVSSRILAGLHDGDSVILHGGGEIANGAHVDSVRLDAPKGK